MWLTAVHDKSERFKLGWVAGFYDALSDDGAKYLDEILRHGLRDQEQVDFITGYRNGLAQRRGLMFGALTHPPETLTQAA